MEEIKKKTTFWIHPSLLNRVDAWVPADNCSSRSEFVEKALRFYIGHLSSEEMTDYLSAALVTVIRGTLDDYANRLRTLLFKLCVEINLGMHIIAAFFHADEDNRRALRDFAIEEVKRTNGQISFERAVEIQSQPHEVPEAEDDNDWLD